MSLTSRANAVIGQLPYNSADLAGCPLNETTQKRGEGASLLKMLLAFRLPPPAKKKKKKRMKSHIIEVSGTHSLKQTAHNLY